MREEHKTCQICRKRAVRTYTRAVNHVYSPVCAACVSRWHLRPNENIVQCDWCGNVMMCYEMLLRGGIFTVCCWKCQRKVR